MIPTLTCSPYLLFWLDVFQFGRACPHWAVCIHLTWLVLGHETMAAALKVSINHAQRRFAFLKDFFRGCKCTADFIFQSHVLWNVSTNGHWNDKFRKAKKPVLIIHLLRSVKYILKLLKLTAARDKTRSQQNEQSIWANGQPLYFYALMEVSKLD